MFAIREEQKDEKFAKANVCVHVELTEEEYRAFMAAKGEASLSEAARQVVDYYDVVYEHRPHKIAFWISKERHAELQANARRKGRRFQSYMRILFADFFRDRAGL